MVAVSYNPDARVWPVVLNFTVRQALVLRVICDGKVTQGLGIVAGDGVWGRIYQPYILVLAADTGGPVYLAGGVVPVVFGSGYSLNTAQTSLWLL